MVLFVGYHESPRRNRANILAQGLLAQYPMGLDSQPEGVYVFSDGLGNLQPRPHVLWASSPSCDTWRVAYCGPMAPDPLVVNAVILPSVSDVTLVTGNE